MLARKIEDFSGKHEYILKSGPVIFIGGSINICFSAKFWKSSLVRETDHHPLLQFILLLGNFD